MRAAQYLVPTLPQLHGDKWHVLVCCQEECTSGEEQLMVGSHLSDLDLDRLLFVRGAAATGLAGLAIFCFVLGLGCQCAGYWPRFLQTPQFLDFECGVQLPALAPELFGAG